MKPPPRSSVFRPGWLHAAGQVNLGEIDEILDTPTLREHPQLLLGARKVGLLEVFVNGVLYAQDFEVSAFNRERLRSFGSWLARLRDDRRSVGWRTLVEESAVELERDELTLFFDLWDRFRLAES